MAKPAQIKTKETKASVEDFIRSIKDEGKQKDCFTLIKLMQKVSKEKPKLRGNAIIGFGNKIYKSPASGREVEWFKMGFSPRKTAFSLHLVLDIKKYGLY